MSGKFKVGDRFFMNSQPSIIVEVVALNNITDKVSYKTGDGSITFHEDVSAFITRFSPVSNDFKGSQPAVTSGAALAAMHKSHQAYFDFEASEFARECLPNKKCSCGTHKTYGPDCDISFHSSWCELRSNNAKI